MKDESAWLNERFLESIPLGVVVIAQDPTQDFRVMYANSSFEQITQYAATDIIGRKMDLLFGPKTRNSSVTELQSALNESRAAKLVMLNYRKDLSPFFNEIHLFPVQNDISHITHMIAIVRDITECVKEREALRRRVLYDALTGVASRQYFLDSLQHAIKNAKRSRGHVMVIYFDVDGLKQLNDSYGHHFGDEILRLFATRINLAVREVDLLGRIGGDEFGLICNLVGDDLKDIETILNRVFDSFSQPVEAGGIQSQLAASAGYAIYPRDGVAADELLRCADSAMYAAKRNGKNTWRAYERYLEPGTR